MNEKILNNKLKKLEKCRAKLDSLESEIRNIKIQKINFVFDEVTQFMMTNPDTPLDDLPEVVKKFLQSEKPPRKTRAKKIGEKSPSMTLEPPIDEILSSGTKNDSIPGKN